MSYGYKWKPSKTQKKAFANKMDSIDKFCEENGIRPSATNDSYYFNLNGKDYRVSNHTIEASNAKAINKYTGEKVREPYHTKDEDIICFTASKTRIMDIFNDLKAGYKLDKRGYKK
ncbi:MAG: hypothetical protein RR348_04940 [Clostridia bacterium]